MALFTTLDSLSQTASSNAADGSTDAPSSIDNQLNLLASFIAQLRDQQLGPAFMASPSAATSLTSGTPVKVTFGNQEYDTNGCYDPATSRFTPDVPGYYWIGGSVRLTNTATATLYIYKNGVQHREIGVTAQTSNQQTSGGCMVYLSGADYVELYCVQSGATQNSSTSSVSTWFQGHLVRLA